MNAIPLVLAACLAVAGCGSSSKDPAPARSARPVSILVEVYDPVTNWVWENVGVRVVESWQEWSGCTCTSPYVEWFLTDGSGQVWLDEFLLADAEVGFTVDGSGRAVLGPESFEDDAIVVLEVDALGHTPVIVEVPLSWRVPDVFVAVPFQ